MPLPVREERSRHPLDRIAFRSAPLDVSGLLQERLFKKTRAAILTSATLAVDGRCDYLASRLGIPDASSLIVPSPFDYRSSVLLYLTDDTPEPTHPHYRDVLERTLIDVIDATRGRALVLFTSHALLGDMARSISGPLQDRGITVLAQRRDGSPQQLTERLRRETNVAVLGTRVVLGRRGCIRRGVEPACDHKTPFHCPDRSRIRRA